MVKAIINGIFKLVMVLVNVLLLPIDQLISQLLPDVSEALNYISNFFDYIGNIVPWVISYLGVNEFVLNSSIAIITFILTVPLMVQAIKLAITWYDKIKP